MESFIKKLEELNLFLVKKDENLVLRGLKGKLDEADKDKIKNNKEIIDFIKTNKKGLLEYLDNRSLIDSFYKLSPLQEGMLFHGLYDESSKTYVEQMSIDFPKGVAVEALKESWNYVIQNHSALRTSFLYEELSIPLQCLYKRVRVPFEELDYSDLNSLDREKKIDDFLIQDCERGFVFNEVPLIRITLIKTGDLSYTMVFTHHHILMDGWSSAILMEELLVAYEAFYKGNTPPKRKEDLYEDYIKYIQKNDIEQEDQFWKEYVKNLKTPTILPFLESTDLRNKGIGNNKKLFLNLEEEFTVRLKQYAKEHRLTMNSIIQGVWALLLSRYTGTPDVVYGVTVSGRPTDLENSEQRLGLYINTLPFYSHIKSNDTVVNWLTALQLNTVSSREYQYTSLAKIQSFSGVKGDLFDSILVFENYPVSEVLKAGSNVLDVSNIKTKEQSNYLLTIAVNLGKQLSIEFNYNDQLLNSSIIEMIKNHFYIVLEQLLISSNLTRVSDIGILTKEEKDQLIYDFNPSENTLAKGGTVVSLFEEQVCKNPNNISVVFQGTTMTYAELDKKANQLAHYLIEEYAIQKEDFIAVKLDRSDQLIISLIAILKTGGTYLPIDPNYPEKRIQYIESDSQCKVSITPKLFADFKEKGSRYKEDAPKVSIESDTLAYVIYTSGSTGRPKGVMIEHGGIVNTITAQINHFSIGSSEHCLQFSNQSFDASIWEILITLLSGSKLFIIEETIKSDIALMTNFINDNKITWATLPPAFVKLIDIEHLHTIKTLITAGEEAPIAKAKAFSKKGTYINAYGPTETSICATVFDGKIEEKVSIGKPIANTRVYILSDDLQLQPLSVVGELCVSGVGVARGYVNKPGLTSERFILDPFISGGRMYRTGDLARWLPDGSLEFLGRKDDQVKIRGYRIELGEIENVLSELEGLDSCCVLSREDGSGVNRLIGYVVSSTDFDKQEAQAFLKHRLPEYMIPQLWVVLEAMPLTSNGKISKKDLPDPDNSGLSVAEYVGYRNKTEEELTSIWQELLGVTKIGVYDNFFDLGGHSLLATRLVSMIRKELEVSVSIRDIFNHTSIASLGLHIDTQSQGDILPSIVSEPKEGKIPLSFSQERLLFIDQLEGSVQYHMPVVLQLEGSLSIVDLESSFREIVLRHEILRTVIDTEEGKGYQRVISSDNWQLTKVAITKELLEDHLSDFISTPFDLSSDYMLRMCLYDLGEDTYVLGGVFHHISSDGWSNGILVREFASLYHSFKSGRGSGLDPLPIQYSDYAIWQRRYIEGSVLENQLSYWDDRLRGVSPLLLPTDYQRPSIQSTQGSSISFCLEDSLSQDLLGVSKEEGVTLFMLLLGVFKVLLYKYSGQSDICVGTPIANRTQSASEDLIGFFVNTLALRSELDPESSFRSFLSILKQTTLSAYDHQETPFEKVVDRVITTRDMSRSPLFQVMFELQNNPEQEELSLESLQLSPYPFEGRTSQFDLTFTAIETVSGISLEVEYCTVLFKESSILRMLNHYQELLRSVVKDRNSLLSDLSILTTAESKLLLEDFNNTAVSYPLEKTFVNLFESQVSKTPESTAIVLGDSSMSYQELDDRSNQVAHYLRSHGVVRDSMVGICLERSLSMFVGILGILKSGGAYVPIKPDYPVSRIGHILEEIGSTIVLTDIESESVVSGLGHEVLVLDIPDSLFLEYPTSSILDVSDPDSLAYVIYTSGSTGVPKGAMIEHAGMLNHLLLMVEELDMDSRSVVAFTAPFTFDISVWQILSSLLCGGRISIYSESQLLDPVGLQSSLYKEGVTILQLVPSYVSGLLDIDSDFDLGGLDYFLVTGEAVHTSLLSKWFSRYPDIPVVNAYGPTEAGDDVSLHFMNEAPSSQNVSIGKPVANMQIYVVDDKDNLCPVGVMGELWVSGIGVGRGYLNDSAKTAKVFRDNPFTNSSSRLYKTGDLGRWLSDGSLEFLGRKDDQVKIRGHRIELGEIESVLSSQSGVNSCCVLAKSDSSGLDRLVGYVVMSGAFDKQFLQDQLNQELPSYMVPLVWVCLEEMPLTVHGKINKKELPDPDMSSLSTASYVAASNEIEEELVRIWQDLLGVEQIGVHDNFFELGGHSLLATRLVAMIRMKMKVEVLIRAVFTHGTISELATHISKIEKGTILPEIVFQKKKGKIPLSFSQERLWFIDQLEGSLQYHIPIVLRLEGAVDKNILEKSFRTIVARHEVLRTVIHSDDGVGYQEVISSEGWKMEVVSIESSENISKNLEDYLSCPFDLSKDYMLRMRLLCLGNDSYILAGVFHHIASDGWSDGILVNEFVGLYNRFKKGQIADLSPLKIQYSDYALWQREHIEGAVLENELGYWEEKLKGTSPLILPTDFPRTSVQSIKGADFNFSLDKELQNGISRICKKHEVTTFMMLLAAFKVVLSKYSGQEDICVGTPIANRTQQETQDLIGFFVNTLVLRSNVNSEESFLKYLKQIKETTLEAYGYQFAPFEKVVERVVETRDRSTSPLFQVLFVFQDKVVNQGNMSLDDVQLSPYDYDRKISSFDITLAVSEVDSGFEIGIAYCVDLFTEETIRRLAIHYRELLSNIVNNAELKINELSIITKEEKNDLLYEFNPKNIVYPKETTVLEMFYKQVELTPNNIALVYKNTSLTYQELDIRTNQLAIYLQEQGILANNFVGICVDRSLEMIIGILGILKSGGAYVPISPDYPEDRIKYILKDTAMRLVLSSMDCVASLENQPEVTCVLLDKDWSTIEATSQKTVSKHIKKEDVAYVIYTSGSTGTPKGVAVSHGNLQALAFSRISYYGDVTSMILLPSFVFDPSVSVIVGTLLTGGRLIVPESLSINDASAMKSLLGGEMDLLLCVPAYYQFLLDENVLDNTVFRGVILGGESLSSTIVSRHFELYPDIPIYNEYGPTECTVWSTVCKLTRSDQRITIGKPIDIAQVYVVDEFQNLVPKGVSGELCISGDGVSKGYLNQEGLTQEVFIENPFVSGNRMYKTGDIVRWLSDDSLEFLGRKDDQVKIRGYRIELGEIENVLSESEDIKSCCILAREDDSGMNRLIGYIVSVNDFDKSKAQEFLKQRLPEYMVPQLWVVLEEMPLTSNGKVDKRALPEPQKSQLSEAEYIAPRNDQEKKLVIIWEELLGVDKIGVSDNFFELGGHSLLATRLVSKIRKDMELEITVKSIFTHPKIADLSIYLENQTNQIVVPKIVKEERKARTPLSFSQERLWFIDKMEGSVAYNLPIIMHLKGKLNVSIFEACFKEIVSRHEILRTVIKTEDGIGYQEVISPENWKLDIVKVENDQTLEAFLKTEISRPFDLSKEYMFRMKLYDLGADKYVMAGVFHHISSDGWSNGILVEEFTELYKTYSLGEQPVLPELPIQYADYALWQRKYLEGTVLEKQLLYWKEKLQGVSPLYLPIDYTRPSIQSTEGANNSLILSKELSDLLKELCEKEGVTLFMLLLAAFKVLLYRYSGQEDICVGTPIANRTQEETEGIIGFFVNTLALRSDLGHSPSFVELLRQVKQVTLDAYNHQSAPFEKVVDAVVERRDRSITPLFQTMFTLQNTIKTKEDVQGTAVVGDLELSSYDFEETTAQFDITLTASNSDAEISFNLEYCTALFKKETIERMLRHYKELLYSIAKTPDVKIEVLSMLVQEEKNQVLHTFNTTKKEYPLNRTILDLFVDQVTETPGNRAVIFGEESLTYAELDTKSNQLAEYILDQGLDNTSFVGISIGQSIEMIIGILGILKAGKTYVPIDPNYPQERIDYILKDAGIEMVLTNNVSSSIFSNMEGLYSIVLESDWSSMIKDTPSRVLPRVSSEDLAYIIYTSGTTGNPKGVLISHDSLYDYSLTCSDYFGFNQSDRIIQQSSISFDTSIEEIFPILVKGGSLFIIEKTNDFEELLRVCERERITILSTNPYLVQYLNGHKEDFSLNIRALISGGDVLKPEYVSNLYEELSVYNTYGPTESTVCISYHKVTSLDGSIPIGKPISNRQVYILNEGQQLNPVGVVGELFVGGSGLAKGYLNKPELTDQQFVPNPFNTGEILYKTGDMGYWLPDGSLVFSGRKDTQVNIRGYRIELGEIESVLASVKSVISCCVISTTDVEGHPRLIGYVVYEGEFDKTILQEALRNRLPEYMVPQLWIPLSSMPLNHSGKIDKKALPTLELASLSSETYVAPVSDIERSLAQVWQDLLGVPKVGIHDNFFDLGGDSIITIQVVSRLKRYGYHLQPRDLFEHQTISGLSQVALLNGSEIKGEQGILVGESNLLPIQQWYFEEAYSQTSQFNQSIFVAINKQINQSFLEQAVKALVAHHDALRFSYVEDEIGWKQHYDHKEAILEVVDLQDASQNEIASLITKACTENQEGLVLDKGDVFKVVLIKTPEYEKMNRLFIVAHHLIVDGVSWRIILDDFNAILEAVNKEEKIDLGVKGSSYREWVDALSTYAIDTSVMEQLPYWKTAINAYTPLPVDKKNERSTYKDIIDYSIKLNAEYTAILLKEIHQSYGTEIDDILLCCLVLTINEWTDQDTVNIGMEGHGREHISKSIDISRTVGWFTSLYPVSLSIARDLSLGDLIKTIKEQLRRIPEKGIGYGALRYLHPSEDIRNQLSGISWDIVFNYLGQLDNTVQAGDIIGRADESSGEEIGGDVPFYEKLAVNSSIAGGELIMGWSFSKKEYDIKTIEKLAESYLYNLKQLIDHCKNKKQRELTPSDYGLQKEIEYDEFSTYAETLIEEDVNGQLSFAPLYQLSPLQEGMLFHGVFTEHSNAYVEQLVIDFSKPIDTETMRISWEYVIQNHSILRSAFIYGKFSTPLQRVHKNVKLPFEELDYSVYQESEQEALLSSFLEEDKNKGFEFSKPPLMRITIIKSTSDIYKMVFTHHHIVMDGWSLSIMVGELMMAYETISKGEKLPEIKEDLFEEYIKYIAEKDPYEEKRFWKKYLDKLEFPTLLSFSENRLSRNKGIGDYRINSEIINSTDTEKLKEYAQKNRITVNTIVQWVWSLLLSKYTGNKTVVYGVTVSGRPTGMENSENKVGLYINTLPLCTSIDHDKTVVASLQEIQKAHTICREHQYTSLATVQQYSGIKGDLFDSILVFENYPISEEVFKEESLLEVTSMEAKEKTNYPLTITVSLGRELEIDFSYNMSSLGAEKVTMIKGHFNKVLDQLLNLPDAAVVSEVNILSDKENELLEIFNETSVAYPKDKTVIDLFTQHVINTPDAIAVVYENEELSYKELDKRSNQLARYLQEQGVVPNTLVGICLERSLEMLIGIFGILKSGGAYVPIDPAYPKNRIDYIIKDAGIDLILSSGSSASVIIERDDLSVVLLDSHWDSISGFSTKKLSSLLPSYLAYVIYTSGSTGKPKGVMIEHGNITNLISSQTHTFNFDPSDVVLQFSNFVFDASVEQIFIALCNGSKLVLINEKIILDPLRLLDFIDDERITHLHTTPSMLSTLPIGRILQSLKRVVVGGEICSKELMLDWSENYTFYNEYGPTETTVTSVMSIYKEVKDNKAISIGTPIGNTQVYIMNERHALLPIGVVGELCIGGAGVTRGYLNQEQLTKDKFISNPFVEGDRIYKTGDLACWLPDGTIEFIGRKDDQVKIRGYRIELGEIENTLSSIASVIQCCVLAKEDASGIMSLVGYVVVEGVLDKEKLQEALRLSLPEYMIPMLWVAMDRMPLNSNGKLDKKSLPEPDISQLSTQEYIAPQNETEEQMVAIWQELLQLEMIGVQDDFFELGGHSILAMKLISQVNKKFSKALPIVFVFEYPTIKLFSEAINSNQKKEYKVLVPLNEKGEEKPIFCVHPLGGTVIVYKELSDALGDKQPFYAFQSSGLDGLSPILKTVEEMAAVYIKEMQKIDAKGPYRLAGYSFGGKIAFEMTKQLELEGFEVEEMLLFDVGPPVEKDLEEELEISYEEFLMVMIEGINKEYNVSIAVNASDFENKSEEEQLEKLYDLIRTSEIEITEAQMRGTIGVIIANEYSNYKPPINSQIKTTIKLFKAGEELDEEEQLLEATLADDGYGWNALTTKEVEVFKVSGNHSNMLNMPYVLDIVKCLKVNN